MYTAQYNKWNLSEEEQDWCPKGFAKLGLKWKPCDTQDQGAAFSVGVETPSPAGCSWRGGTIVGSSILRVVGGIAFVGGYGKGF